MTDQITNEITIETSDDFGSVLQDKKTEVSKIIVEHIKENYTETDWRYVDFVDEDRFLMEIGLQDKGITSPDLDVKWDEWDIEDIAEYFLDQICRVSPLEMGQMNREY